MSKPEKLLEQLRSATRTFPWADLLTVMKYLGYRKKEMAGSRVRFHNPETGHLLRLHTPHPENYLKGGALKDVRHSLKQEGYL